MKPRKIGTSIAGFLHSLDGGLLTSFLTSKVRKAVANRAELAKLSAETWGTANPSGDSSASQNFEVDHQSPDSPENQDKEHERIFQSLEQLLLLGIFVCLRAFPISVLLPYGPVTGEF